GIETMIRMHNSMAEKFPTIPLRFSLNLSTKQLLDPQLANSFIEIMNKNQAKPEWFMLEVNDFMMVERIAVIKTNIYKLRDYGFKIAVDGFELDGQSVQNIQKSPVDVIKLGRNFLKDVENNFMKERFLQILVKYAEDNNKELISEGIETAEITKYVKEQNVFLGQGYYFAKPLSEEAFEEYIEKRQYQVLLDDVSALEDNEALFKEMHSDDVVPEEEHEETPEEYLDRISRETHTNSDNDNTEGDDLFVSNPSDDDLLV
ncbi:MAG: EAL domain-containing protein, partial [Acholeplasmatales bacterium]|nr:EAL domain-containing protein [Acholeplasmatales bacterium]